MTETEKPLIHLEDVYVRYPDKSLGRTKTVLNDVDLKIYPHELVSLTGPSGCGKSTLLRLVLGAEKPESGILLIDGKPIDGPDRTRGIVYQNYSLFPHLTALENILAGLDLEQFSFFSRRLRPFYRHERYRQFREEAMHYFDRVGLKPSDASKYIYELSGGMRQRVAIAQAFIMKPKILLMDEPFSALDDTNRQRMQVFLLELWKEADATIMFVTHNLEEAVFLGTRVTVLSQYYITDTASEGAKIVCDKETPGSHPKSTDFRYTSEFNSVVELVRQKGLKPEHALRIQEFDLTHPHAFRTVKPEEWKRSTP